MDYHGLEALIDSPSMNDYWRAKRRLIVTCINKLILLALTNSLTPCVFKGASEQSSPCFVGEYPLVRNLKCPLLYQLIKDMLPFIITRDWPRCAGVELQTSMFWGKPVQSLFLVLSSPQQYISAERGRDGQILSFH